MSEDSGKTDDRPGEAAPTKSGGTPENDGTQDPHHHQQEQRLLEALHKGLGKRVAPIVDSRLKQALDEHPALQAVAKLAEKLEAQSSKDSGEEDPHDDASAEEGKAGKVDAADAKLRAEQRRMKGELEELKRKNREAEEAAERERKSRADEAYQKQLESLIGKSDCDPSMADVLLDHLRNHPQVKRDTKANEPVFYDESEEPLAAMEWLNQLIRAKPAFQRPSGREGSGPVGGGHERVSGGNRRRVSDDQFLKLDPVSMAEDLFDSGDIAKGRRRR